MSRPGYISGSLLYCTSRIERRRRPEWPRGFANHKMEYQEELQRVRGDAEQIGYRGYENPHASFRSFRCGNL